MFPRLLECERCGRQCRLSPPDAKPIRHWFRYRHRVIMPKHPGSKCEYGRRRRKCQGTLQLVAVTEEEFNVAR
jgi:hypothetical protein